MDGKYGQKGVSAVGLSILGQPPSGNTAVPALSSSDDRILRVYYDAAGPTGIAVGASL